MQSIKQVLMKRDGMTEQEAQDIIKEAREMLQEYLASNDQEAAYNICQEYFGLEPDYLTEIM